MLYKPSKGNVFGQTRSYGPMAPGLDFAFGFVDENYVTQAKERGWLKSGIESDLDERIRRLRPLTIIAKRAACSPISSHADEVRLRRSITVNLEIDLEPIRGLKIRLTNNRTDSHTDRIQFMYDDMPVARGGSYTKTHCAIATSLRTSKAVDGYRSDAFQRFLSNIPIVADRIERRYDGLRYPMGGFMKDNPNAGRLFDPKVGGVNRAGSDVLIPAFLAAYTGVDASDITCTPSNGAKRSVIDTDEML